VFAGAAFVSIFRSRLCHTLRRYLTLALIDFGPAGRPPAPLPPPRPPCGAAALQTSSAGFPGSRAPGAAAPPPTTACYATPPAARSQAPPPAGTPMAAAPGPRHLRGACSKVLPHSALPPPPLSAFDLRTFFELCRRSSVSGMTGGYTQRSAFFWRLRTPTCPLFVRMVSNGNLFGWSGPKRIPKGQATAISPRCHRPPEPRLRAPGQSVAGPDGADQTLALPPVIVTLICHPPPRGSARTPRIRLPPLEDPNRLQPQSRRQWLFQGTTGPCVQSIPQVGRLIGHSAQSVYFTDHHLHQLNSD